MPRSKNVRGDRAFDEVGLNQPDEERLHLGTTPNYLSLNFRSRGSESSSAFSLQFVINPYASGCTTNPETSFG